MEFSLEIVISVFAMSESCQKTSSEAVVYNRACVYPVPHVSLRIDDAQPIDGGIKQLLKYIRPDWPTERLQFKVTFLLLERVSVVTG